MCMVKVLIQLCSCVVFEVKSCRLGVLIGCGGIVNFGVLSKSGVGNFGVLSKSGVGFGVLSESEVGNVGVLSKSGVSNVGVLSKSTVSLRRLDVGGMGNGGVLSLCKCKSGVRSGSLSLSKVNGHA